jgi:formate dehydrogenase subunit gamma
MSEHREPGKTILRYNANERTNHWLVAILFFMAGLSGLALFHPAMFWLTNLFGGGPWTRILHPFMGVAMFVFFCGLVIRFWRANLFIPNDRLWLKRIDRVMVNSEEGVPPIGKYNPGQKLLFWTLLLCMLALLLSGVVIWRAYFSEYFGITSIRLGALVHALAGFVLITSIIVHIYAGIWIKGSVGAMLHGWVSRRWAKKHHALWYRKIVDEEGPPVQAQPRVTKKG